MKTSMFFREEDAGGESGGGGRGAAVFEEGEKHEAQNEPKPEEKTQVVDAAALAKEFGSVISGVLDKQKPAEAPQKELSPEEARKMLNVFEIDDEFVTELGDLKTQKGALVKLRDGLLRQFDTLAQMRMAELRAGLEGDFKPVKEYVTKAQVKERDHRFAETFPALAKPELRPLIEAVRSQIEKDGKTTVDNEEEYFKAIADGTVAVIKTQNPDFTLEDKTPAEKTKQPAARQSNAIPVTSGGSGGGGGGQQQQQPAKSRGLQVFDNK